MDLLALCSQVQNAVRQAAKHMEQVFTTQEKGSCANIVTSADLAIQAELEQVLCALLPGSALFGEESVGRAASAPAAATVLTFESSVLTVALPTVIAELSSSL